MILSDFLRALGQLPDPRFRGVLLLGVGLTVVLLAAMSLGFLELVRWLTPDQVTLPWVGVTIGLDGWASAGSILLMLALSVFLMVPVASAFTGLFLDRVADAVEDRHYPGLPPVRPMSVSAALADSAAFLALLLALNAAALVIYPFIGPFAPLLFWALNGFLLGREYFTLAALRRMDRPAARALRSRHAAEIWLAGTLMAAPLSIPLVNLLVPVLGVATFIHLFHRVSAKGRAGS